MAKNAKGGEGHGADTGIPGKHSEETWFCEQRAAVSVGVKGDGTGTKLGKTADLIAKGTDGDQSWRVLLSGKRGAQCDRMALHGRGVSGAGVPGGALYPVFLRIYQ